MPTYRGARFISYVLESLGQQSISVRANFEVIVAIKPSGDGTEDIVQEICDKHDFQHQILIQREGYFTHALNMCLKSAEGNLILFTDDDAILPKNWISACIDSHIRHKSSGAISGKVINYDVHQNKIFQSEVERPSVRLYRVLLRPVLDPPHFAFRDYRLGVYITRRFSVAAGPAIPYKTCLSLPCRGVNMSFKKEAVQNALFPEHPDLVNAPSNEQYFGAQLVLRGWKSIFDPSIFVYHILRESLSRTKKDKRIRREKRIMKCLFKRLVTERCIDWTTERINSV